MKNRLDYNKMSSEATKYLYSLNSWTLNTHTNELSNATETALLEHRHTCLLVYFLEHPNEILKKDQILQAVWQNKVVNDESLAVAISQLRKALKDNARIPRYIKTIPGIGYQFISSATDNPSLISQANLIEKNPAYFRYSNSKLIGLVCILLVLVTSWLVTRPENKPEELLSQSLLLLQSEKDSDLRKAIVNFKQLLKEQPENARVYLGIAEAKMKLLGSEAVADEHYGEVMGLLEKALQQNPDLARAHMWMAYLISWHDLDYQSAEQHYKQGLEINPNDELILAHYTHFLLVQKRFTEVDFHVQQKRELNPLNYSRVDMAWAFLLENQFHRAEKELDRIAKTEPMDFSFHQIAGNVYFHLGKEQQAYAHLKWFFEHAHFDKKRIDEFDRIFTTAGLKKVYATLLEQKEPADLGHNTPPLSWARYALASDQKEKALIFLKQAIEQRQPHAECIADPIYHSILNDDSIKSFSQKILNQPNYVQPE
jgi:DNA-binding winged helix-turn-helix (wHTH) protein/Tfp pilus assembly protein PilF